MKSALCRLLLSITIAWLLVGVAQAQTLILDSNEYEPGQTVNFAFINDTVPPRSVWVPVIQPWAIYKARNIIFGTATTQLYQELLPGEVIIGSWDQTNELGQLVSNGRYQVGFRYLESASPVVITVFEPFTVHPLHR